MMTKIVHDTDIGAGLDISGGKLNVAETMATDAEVAAQIAAADAAEVSQERAYLMPRIMVFDQVEHSKLSLPVVAEEDPTVSKWIKVPTSPQRLTSPTTGKLIVVNFDYITAYHGGYPNYTTDTSVTFAQFCVAPNSSNSDEINANLATTGQVPPLAGSWSRNVGRVIAASIAVGGNHPYSELWVRFVNKPARTGDVAQNVTQFGGNCPFRVNSVYVYDSIANGLS